MHSSKAFLHPPPLLRRWLEQSCLRLRQSRPLLAGQDGGRRQVVFGNPLPWHQLLFFSRSRGRSVRPVRNHCPQRRAWPLACCRPVYVHGPPGRDARARSWSSAGQRGQPRAGRHGDLLRGAPEADTSDCPTRISDFRVPLVGQPEAEGVLSREN